jgi:hypothetical protein
MQANGKNGKEKRKEKQLKQERPFMFTANKK